MRMLSLLKNIFIKTPSPSQNENDCADEAFKGFYYDEKDYIFPGIKPLSKSMMTYFKDAYVRHSASNG